MLVRPIIVPTPICIRSLTIGGTLTGLRPIVSISSTKLTSDIPIPMMRTIRSRFSRRGEKSPKRNISGVSMTSITRIDIPAPYGAGARHFSDL